jgi:hypothetical protein
MFSDWASRWEQLITDQKSRMYIVQGDGGLIEKGVKQENLDSKTVALIVDVGALAIWIWHGKDVGPKDKFVGARAARALRSVVGPKFRTMSPIGEGEDEEPSDFLKVFESGGISKEPSAPSVELEDIPEEPFISSIQLEDIPEEPFISSIQLEDTIPSKKVIEEVTNSIEIDTPVSPPVTNTTESKMEEPPEVSLPSLDSEKIRDLASLIVTYTLKQIYRIEPITSRTKTHDLFRVSQEGVQLCKLKIGLQNTTLNVFDAFFDEKEEEGAFYDALNEHLHLLHKITLSS